MLISPKQKLLIGMVHVRALPGTPRSVLSIDEIVATAVREATVLEEFGFNAVLIENMHDVPYLNRHVGPEIVACMARVTAAVRAAVKCPVGVQVLAGANEAALAVALAAEAQFVRTEGLVFAHVADEGLMQSDAGTLLRYRRTIGASHIQIFADIKKKHSSHAITADVTLAETAHAAEFAGADGVIVTGAHTGDAVSSDDLMAAAAGTRLPVLVGSGATADNLERYWKQASGFVVGSCLKQGGRWDAPIDVPAVERFAAVVRVLEADYPSTTLAAKG